jgi:hypothetical protein
MINDSNIAEENRTHEDASTVNRAPIIVYPLKSLARWYNSGIEGLGRTAAADQFSAAWRAAFSERLQQCAQMRKTSRQNREQRIRERAYFLSQQCGFPSGRDLEFWVQASELEPRWLWPGRLRAWLGGQKDAVSTIQAVATVLALTLGGVWTYKIFVLERVTSPHIDLSQVVTGKLISPDWYWIQVSITAKNTGRSLAKFDTADIEVDQITPLPENIQEDIKDGYNPVAGNVLNIPWKGLCRYIRPFSPTLESGESAPKVVEFIIPAWLQTVRIVTFLTSKSVANGQGWNVLTIYNLTGSTNDESQAMSKLTPDNHLLCTYDRDH